MRFLPKFAAQSPTRSQGSQAVWPRAQWVATGLSEAQRGSSRLSRAQRRGTDSQIRKQQEQVTAESGSALCNACPHSGVCWPLISDFALLDATEKMTRSGRHFTFSENYRSMDDPEDHLCIYGYPPQTALRPISRGYLPRVFCLSRTRSCLFCVWWAAPLLV